MFWWRTGLGEWLARLMKLVSLAAQICSSVVKSYLVADRVREGMLFFMARFTRQQLEEFPDYTALWTQTGPGKIEMFTKEDGRWRHSVYSDGKDATDYILENTSQHNHICLANKEVVIPTPPRLEPHQWPQD